MPSVLITASTFSHIVNFHLPYLRRFRELGWQVDVACGGAMRDIPFADVTAALPLEKKMSSPANLRAAKLLRGMMEREHYDLVITHTSLASFFTRWAARGMKNRPPIVNVMHGYLFTDETPAVKKLLLTRAELLTAPQTDLLLTMNAWDTRWAAAHHAAARVEEIPGMGVDLSRFRAAGETRQAMRDRLGLTEGDIALLYPAEFSGRKDQAMLLRAMKRLPPHIKLLLPGSGELLDACRGLAAQLGVADRVQFPGQVHDIPAWLGAADIAVSASRSEGLPFNIMEAMACGRPVLATRSGGMPEYLEGSQAVLVERPDRAGKRSAVPPWGRGGPRRRGADTGGGRRAACAAGTGRPGEDAAVRAGYGAAAGDGTIPVRDG